MRIRIQDFLTDSLILRDKAFFPQYGSYLENRADLHKYFIVVVVWDKEVPVKLCKIKTTLALEDVCALRVLSFIN